MIFEIDDLDMGVFGDRNALFEATVMVEGPIDAFPSILIHIDKMEIWNERQQRVIDMTHWLDAPHVRQRLETLLEEIHEANMYAEAKYGNMENDDPKGAA